MSVFFWALQDFTRCGDEVILYCSIGWAIQKYSFVSIVKTQSICRSVDLDSDGSQLNDKAAGRRRQVIGSNPYISDLSVFKLNSVPIQSSAIVCESNRRETTHGKNYVFIFPFVHVARDNIPQLKLNLKISVLYPCLKYASWIRTYMTEGALVLLYYPISMQRIWFLFNSCQDIQNNLNVILDSIFLFFLAFPKDSIMPHLATCLCASDGESIKIFYLPQR